MGLVKGVAIPESVAEMDMVTLTLQRIAATPKIDAWDQAGGRGVDQMEQQESAVRRAIQRQIAFNITEGTAPAFVGLRTSAFQTALNNAVTGALTLQDIYRAKNLVRGSGGPGRPGGPGVGCCDMVMNEKTQRELMGLLDQAGLTPEYVFDEDVGCEVPSFFSSKIYINNNIPLDEGTGNDRTSIYFLSFDSPTAAKLLYAIAPEHPQDIDGICSYPLPIKPATNELNSYVGWYGCLFNPEGQSVVRLTDIKPTFFAQ